MNTHKIMLRRVRVGPIRSDRIGSTDRMADGRTDGRIALIKFHGKKRSRDSPNCFRRPRAFFLSPRFFFGLPTDLMASEVSREEKEEEDLNGKLR